MIRNTRSLLMTVCLGVLSIPVQAQSDTTAVERQAWETMTGGVFLSLTQILPDQARAFYVTGFFP